VKTSARLLLALGLLFIASLQSAWSGSYPEPPLRCVVGSFDFQNVQLKCGTNLKDKRQMNRAYFEKVYGDATEGKVVKIDTSNTATAGQLKSY
jgi:hypothetical protein